jgi:hypothetical protein
MYFSPFTYTILEKEADTRNMEDYSLSAYDIVLIGNWSLTFQRSLLLPSSRLLKKNKLLGELHQTWKLQAEQ